MTDHEKLQLLASVLFTVGVELERTLDALGVKHKKEADHVEDALNRLTREWPDLVPIETSKL